VGKLVKVPRAGGRVAPMAKASTRAKTSSRAKASTSRSYISHRVRRGQTLSLIAKKYGTSVGALRQHNRIRNPGQLRAGQMIKVPGS
jgi:membrane-bound lytic murein transglycosylase D